VRRLKIACWEVSQTLYENGKEQQHMDGRKRTVQVKFRVTEAERDLILEKMKLIPTNNMAAYLRKIAIDGYIVQVDHSDIKAMTAEIQKIGVNINQIARRVNSTGNVYQGKLMPPTRVVRYCCSVLKESAGGKRCMVLGIRRAEGAKRANSGVAELPGKVRGDQVVFDMDNGDERIIAPCQKKAKIKIHPIVDWRDRDVWQFLRDAKVEMNPCYSMGQYRVGCIACPMAGNSRYVEFRQWPKFENLYRKAFARMLEARKAKGKDGPWQTADDVFRWWMEDKNLDGQLDLWGGEIGGAK